MLGRLRIQLEQSIPVFAKLVNEMFSKKKLISTRHRSVQGEQARSSTEKIARDATETKTHA
jgi:hypothetical protein